MKRVMSQNPPLPTDPTREIAFDLLRTVLERRHTLEEGLESASGAEPRDRAAAHRLAASVLRRLGSIDALLDTFLARAPPEGVRHALRLGTAGLLLLDTPAHAAVGTAVDLVAVAQAGAVRRAGERGAAQGRGAGTGGAG